jgi:YebC/PmpR family DNA-binding regulatory protein
MYLRTIYGKLMAGHSQFKNIMHRKGAQDAKRAKLFTKILREITVAAKLGGPEMENNPRLRSAMILARNANLPKDRILNAINKATNANDLEQYDEMRYEGYGPGNLAIIVEALTDNRNRTASEVRSAFTKHGGNLGENGSVSFMFKRIGLIIYPESVGSFEQVFEATVEASGDDCVQINGVYEINCDPEDLNEVREALEKKLGTAENVSITWKPNSIQLASLEDGEKLIKLIDALEDCDDVQNVIGNFEFSQELLDKIKND